MVPGDAKASGTIATQVIGPGGAQLRVEDRRTHELLEQLNGTRLSRYAGVTVGNSYPSGATVDPFTVAARLGLAWTQIAYQPIKSGSLWDRPTVKIVGKSLVDHIVETDLKLADGQVIFIDSKGLEIGMSYDIAGIASVVGVASSATAGATVIGRSSASGNNDARQTFVYGLQMLTVRRL